ncbi:c-type cytochrome [Marinobacter lacisalsi]|uniref:C-type cytochrome n=1 Tax=Marinobacter lacisalsi TaxID=475979 RepID=A0ABV8QI53_9GAMM
MTALIPRVKACCCRLLVFVLVTIPVSAVSDDKVDDAELRNLVLQDCGSCHGMTLRGGLGPSLRPDDLAQMSVGAIAALIREGVPGTAMPPWKALLSEPEIHWISERLKSGALMSGQDE